MLVKSAIAELMGSFAITFFGSFARLTNTKEDYLSIGLSYFFLISAMTYCFVHLSGAQFNPFLTAALVITKQMEVIKGILNIIAQFIGSFLAGLAMFAIYVFPADEELHRDYGQPTLSENQFYGGLGLEFFSIFILTYVYCSLIMNVKAPKYIIGIALASVYAASVICFGHINGGCVSFIEIFGPSVFSGKLGELIYYAVVHCFGALFSAFIFAFVLQEHANIIHPDYDENNLPSVGNNTLGLKEDEGQDDD